MKRISLIAFALMFSLAGISAQDRGKEKAQEKKEQGKEHAEKAKEKREEGQNKARDKKSQAKDIGRIEKKIAHLKEVAAKLEEKGNTEAAANVRKAIEKAEMKLKEKKKSRGITDADVKAAESAEGETK